MRPPVQNGGQSHQGFRLLSPRGSRCHHVRWFQLLPSPSHSPPRRFGCSSRNLIVISPERKSSFSRIALCSGIRVSTPSNMVSSKAAFILEMASALLGDHTIIFANNESKEAGISYPVWAWESTLTPGPLGQ